MSSANASRKRQNNGPSTKYATVETLARPDVQYYELSDEHLIVAMADDNNKAADATEYGNRWLWQQQNAANNTQLMRPNDDKRHIVQRCCPDGSSGSIEYILP